MNAQHYYDRLVRLDAGLAGETGRSWAGLRVSFEVQKIEGRTPDTAAIAVYNLNEDSRGFVERAGTIIRLAAGYKGQGNYPPIIFQGDLRAASIVHAREGADWVTRFEAADGQRVLTATNLSVTYRGPIGSRALLSRIAEAMGLTYAQIPANMPLHTYMNGYSIFGPVKEALDDIVHSAGAQWTVQDGELVVTMEGEATAEAAVVLSPKSGLIGKVEKLGDQGVKVVGLMNGRIKPGRWLSVESDEFSGLVIPYQVTHAGDSGWLPDFYTTAECRI